MRLISVVAPCYNEEANVRELYERVRRVFDDFPQYTLELIFIDNASKDQTVAILRELAEADSRVKVIVNARNFGHIRSPVHAIFQASGDAVIGCASDLQDPPELIRTFLQKWEAGYKVAVGIKKNSREPAVFHAFRTAYYRLLRAISDVDLLEHYTGFGLYDRQVVEIIRGLDDPEPYFRGAIAEIGFESAKIEYTQPRRMAGVTKNNFYTLFDLAMNGMTSYSKVPLRLATMLGFAVAAMSLVVAFGYFIYKLLFWDSFSVGLAPLVLGVFFFSAVQLFFLGIVGEYVGSIHTQVRKRPLVVEKERINFQAAPAATTVHDPALPGAASR
jgi:polyisoprenyl-phosphate glycosyltransferase